jgi:hypothetical protein
MRRFSALALLCSLLAAACTRKPSPPAEAPPLPDLIPGFTSGPLGTAPAAFIRTYARGSSQVTVTLARFPMDASQYDSWVRTSIGGFPQARLDVPDGEGNGFYQCDDGKPPRCSLLIQLRSGVHLEIRGVPASRDEVDAVARGLPLRRLAAPGT